MGIHILSEFVWKLFLKIVACISKMLLGYFFHLSPVGKLRLLLILKCLLGVFYIKFTHSCFPNLSIYLSESHSIVLLTCHFFTRSQNIPIIESAPAPFSVPQINTILPLTVSIHNNLSPFGDEEAFLLMHKISFHLFQSGVLISKHSIALEGYLLMILSEI